MKNNLEITSSLIKIKWMHLLVSDHGKMRYSVSPFASFIFDLFSGVITVQ